MIRRCLPVAVLLLGAFPVSTMPSGRVDAAYWVYLDSKTGAGGRPLDWHAHGFQPTSTQLGLPLDSRTVARISQHGIKVRFCSRWLNAVSVNASTEQVAWLREQSMVHCVEPVRRWRPPLLTPASKSLAAPQRDSQSRFGLSFDQLDQIGVTGLQNLGLDGSDVIVALLDDGYELAGHPAFASLRVVAARDFVNGDDIVGDQADQPVTGDEVSSSQNIHGAQVLSLIAGSDAGRFMGAAPGASFLLAKTEDAGEEMPVEEDRWVAGLEWADSLGARVVSSSLGYNLWDDGGGYSYEDLDGETTATSRAAVAAVERGMVVVVAAGNEATNGWQYVTTPADARGVIAVGSVDMPLPGTRPPELASTSSHGPTADGRIKPDVVAPGQGVVAADIHGGGYARVNGTSFATPLVGGACALLLQAHPEWGPLEVMEALRSTAIDLGPPGADNRYGWGQIDALAASGLDPRLPDSDLAGLPYPNPVTGNEVHFPMELVARDQVRVSIYSNTGELVFADEWSLSAGLHTDPDRAPKWGISATESARGETIADGIFLYRLIGNGVSRSGKIALVRGFAKVP